MKINAEKIVTEFNNCINSQNLEGIGSIMTDDHSFIDTENSIINGKEKCLKAWDGFFKAFPDYKNAFTKIQADGNFAVIVGHSKCSQKILDGPALWTAKVENGKIREWRVYKDTMENRKLLNIF
jgi:ketosteroid isomerase-like protein